MSRCLQVTFKWLGELKKYVFINREKEKANEVNVSKWAAELEKDTTVFTIHSIFLSIYKFLTICRKYVFHSLVMGSNFTTKLNKQC